MRLGAPRPLLLDPALVAAYHWGHRWRLKARMLQQTFAELWLANRPEVMSSWNLFFDHYLTLQLPTYYLARACTARGREIGRGVHISAQICKKNFRTFSILQNTHFQTPISTQEGFASNLIASNTP